MYLSKRARSSWLRKIDNRTLNFMRRVVKMDYFYPLITLSEEPMTAQELLENGVTSVPLDLDYLGLTTRTRVDDSKMVYKLTKKGLELSIAIKQFLLTIKECLPEEEEGGPGKIIREGTEGFI